MQPDQAALPSSPPVGTAPAEQAPRILQQLLEQADVRFNGGRPWDIQVRNPRLYRRAMTSWSLGFGEAYIDGDWDCECLDLLFHRLLRTNIEWQPAGLARLRLALESVRQRLVNLQTPQRAAQVGEQHYDAGNDIFEAMLDPQMIYSCAHWERAATLAEAQTDKLAMICRKLPRKPACGFLRNCASQPSS